MNSFLKSLLLKVVSYQMYRLYFCPRRPNRNLKCIHNYDITDKDTNGVLHHQSKLQYFFDLFKQCPEGQDEFFKLFCTKLLDHLPNYLSSSVIETTHRSFVVKTEWHPTQSKRSEFILNINSRNIFRCLANRNLLILLDIAIHASHLF